MNIVTLENIRKTYGEKELYDLITFGIDEHDKMGVIGINGTGKSTLLKIVSGEEVPDEGNVVKASNLKIAQLPQTPVFSETDDLLRCVLSEKEDLADGWNMEIRAREMLEKLGFHDLSVRAGVLSGGEKKKLALIKTMIVPSDLMILDEPTNHLDLSMIRWLEDELKSYKGALLLVSHDRYFLDEVCNRIIEIDNTRLYSGEANYSGFLLQKARRMEEEAVKEVKRQNYLRSETEWVKRGARARTTKQKARLSRYEELTSMVPLDTRVKEQVEMESLGVRMGKKTIEIEGIAKAYDGKELFHDVTYYALRNDRVGIIGPNGCGKSTFLKILAGEIEPDQGTVRLGETLRIGYLSQEMDEIEAAPKNQRVIDYIKDVAEFIQTSSGRISAAKMLERFLFEGAQQVTPLEKLSGGEKRRLMLLKVLMQAPNVLLLDEPTNDLDMATMTIFEDFLAHFDGIVFAISHDRYFLDTVCDRILAFGKDRTVQRYDGNFTDYTNKMTVVTASSKNGSGKNALTKEKEGASKGSAGAKAGRAHADRLRFSFKEQREFETIEEEIASIEDRLTRIDEEMAQFATDFVKLGELTEEKEEKEALLEVKMERWEYLTDLSERIEAEKQKKTNA